MDIAALNSISPLNLSKNGTAALSSTNSNETFEGLFQSALSMVKNTNNLTNTAEQAEISYALGLTNSPLELQTAQAKASTSLQYTVAVRNKVLEAYKEIMNLQF